MYERASLLCEHLALPFVWYKESTQEKDVWKVHSVLFTHSKCSNTQQVHKKNAFRISALPITELVIDRQLTAVNDAFILTTIYSEGTILTHLPLKRLELQKGLLSLGSTIIEDLTPWGNASAGCWQPQDRVALLQKGPSWARVPNHVLPRPKQHIGMSPLPRFLKVKDVPFSSLTSSRTLGCRGSLDGCNFSEQKHKSNTIRKSANSVCVSLITFIHKLCCRWRGKQTMRTPRSHFLWSL